MFDSVAALGARGTRRLVLATLLGAAVLVASYAAARFASWMFGLGFLWAFLPLLAALGAVAAWKWRVGMNWRAGHYDRLLSGHVAYARHALAIDENRKDFERVKWGSTVQPAPRPEGSPEPLIQLWFAGNHSDIGGSYPEAESRLSDIALDWMIEQVREIPDPLILDDTKLHRSPSPGGIQHCEVAGMADLLAQRFWGLFARIAKLRWATQLREIDHNATVHPSVLERFNLPDAPQCAGSGPYRPEALRAHDDFKHFY